MKKTKLLILSSLTALAMCVSFTSCGENKDDENSNSSNSDISSSYTSSDTNSGTSSDTKSDDKTSSIFDDDMDDITSGNIPDDGDSSDGVIDDIVSKTESDMEDFADDTKSDIDDIIHDDDMIKDDDKDNTKDKDTEVLAPTVSASTTTSNTSSSDNTDSTASDSTDNTINLDNLDNTSHGWGQGVDVDEQNRPTSCTTYQNKYGKYDTYFIKDTSDTNQNKTIYLTFDEGYENGYTSQILDVLKQKDCKAVFFVTLPYAKENPSLIKRMIDEGHVVGNHTVNHKSMPTLSTAEVRSELLDLHDYMVDNYNYTMTLFRPPMGEWSERTLAVTQSVDYKSVFWSFAYKDWITDDQPEKAESLDKISKASHDGAIYLLHAVSSTNTAILGDFIENMRKDGFTFSVDI